MDFVFYLHYYRVARDSYLSFKPFQLLCCKWKSDFLLEESLQNNVIGNSKVLCMQLRVTEKSSLLKPEEEAVPMLRLFPYQIDS